MSEVNRYVVDCNRLWKGGRVLFDVEVSVVLAADFDRVTAERDAALGREAQLRVDREDDDSTFNNAMERLQQRLTAADERADELEGLLRSMTESYAVALDAGYDRITALGGDCDSVSKMLADNPDYAKARAALNPTAEGASHE